MAPSNRTPGKAQGEAPSEPFKRAIAGCFKAIAGVSEFEVAFGAERPALIPGRVRLPEPPRRVSPHDAAIVRGHADSLALRQACHDMKLHHRMQPAGEQARAIFEAVEQTRVEAIGANRLPGTRSNLAAMLSERYRRTNYADISQRSEAPLEEAIALMVRERLTGEAPPREAHRVVELWRDYVESRAGDVLSRLAGSVENQKAFSQLTRDILTSLDMGEDGGSKDDRQDGTEEKDGGQDEQGGEDSQTQESDEQPTAADAESELSDEDLPEGEMESDSAPADTPPDGEEVADLDEPGEALHQRPPRDAGHARTGISRLHHPFR